MCDQDHFEEDRLEYEKRGLETRREFGVLLGGVGMMMLLPPVANAQAVAEREVTIKTPDGSADGYFVYPAKGSAAGVLFWPDIFGLRPATRQMGKRLAQSGYSVLVVNPFYRQRKSPVAENASSANIKELFPLMQALTETTQMTDARAFIAWLDQQPEVNRNRKIGTQGYCMGGPIAFRTAAAVPDRVGAVAAFHPAALVTEGPNSPHLQAMKSKAQFLVALGDNDDKQRPQEKDILRETFGKAGLTIEVDVYKAAHGWCPPDSQVYNEPEAERAWSRLVARYKEGLA
jgi:carboxymethylenebutenolidase